MKNKETIKETISPSEERKSFGSFQDGSLTTIDNINIRTILPLQTVQYWDKQEERDRRASKVMTTFLHYMDSIVHIYRITQAGNLFSTFFCHCDITM